MAKLRERRRARHWSRWNVRKKPSEYEVVTTQFQYHHNRDPVPFELDPEMPLNRWYLQYREGSSLQVEDWEGFRDPEQFTYNSYVRWQGEREAYIENLVDEFEGQNHDANLNPDWVEWLGRLYLPSRFPLHALQMTALYVTHMAPSGYITNAASFQAANELRRVQWIAYRAKSLSYAHDPELASSEQTRKIWEEDSLWQPLREAVEKMLIAYDWGEAFTALNLVIKPLFDEVYNVRLAELARRNEDDLLALMVDDFMLNSRWSRDWSEALVKYALEQRSSNKEVFEEWVETWNPLASRGVDTLIGAFEQAPTALQSQDVREKVEAAHRNLLARNGLNTE